MDVHDILTRFPSAKSSGSGWQARCPSHDDRTASLSISTGEDGRILVRCHAGCLTEDIVAAVGLTLRDLFVDIALASTRKFKVVARYPYHAEDGVHLFDVVRLDPKDFRQQRADGVWNMDGVRRVLFGLPDLIDVTDVCVVEGEKDVLALRGLGLAATTNPGGAGKWRDDYARQLVSAGAQRVVVLPDHDEPGQQHAEQVATSCRSVGLTVVVIALPGLPAKGDVSDFIAANDRAELDRILADALKADVAPREAAAATAPQPARRPRLERSLVLTPASGIVVKPVRWLWQDRVPTSALSLEAGREGIGKSIHAASLAADVTRGRLAGVYFGIPRSVIIAATEDSWSHTIVPRLLAAAADLDRIFRVEVRTADLIETTLSLPQDLDELERVIAEQDVALLVLDPLMSRLDSGLDTHKDSEVRKALEPLVALADRTGAAVLGLIHVNKSTTTDPLTSLMGSRAFAAVARAVLFVMTDPDDESVRLLGQAKNNLGRSDLPTLSFRIDGVKVSDTGNGEVWCGKLEWVGESHRTIREALNAASESADARSALQEAADWLGDYLTEQGGTAESKAVKDAGQKYGHSASTLKRARASLNAVVVSRELPRRSFWSLPREVKHDGTNDGTKLRRLGPVVPWSRDLVASTQETSIPILNPPVGPPDHGTKSPDVGPVQSVLDTVSATSPHVVGADPKPPDTLAPAVEMLDALLF